MPTRSRFHIVLRLAAAVPAASVFDPFPSHAPPPTPAREGADYRFGPITVQCVDMPAERGRSARGEPVTGDFVPDSADAVDLPHGVVHIYRHFPPSAPPPPQPSTSASPPLAVEPSPDYVDAHNAMLAVLAVPSWMAPSDFLRFVAPAVDGISHLRMIRDSAPNRSIVVIKFRDTSDAEEFIDAYNGTPFNSMEPEICHVVRVSSVVIQGEDHLSQAVSRLSSPLTHAQEKEKEKDATGGMYELPTCPVCLERMDSAVTGLVTVPCSHSFHCACLSKWGDSRCPVCRYSQTHPFLPPPSPSPSPSPSLAAPPTVPPRPHCTQCNTPANLWVCLVCGHPGCGRYAHAHAQEHFRATQHRYALELETQRVWDYAGDGYVHRLIRGKAGGVVEVSASSRGRLVGGEGRARHAGDDEEEEDGGKEEEFGMVLGVQLEAQREWWEARMEDVRAEMAGRCSVLEERERALVRELEDARARVEEGARRAEREREQEREVASLRAKLAAASARVAALAAALESERALSQGLLENLSRAREERSEREREREAREREREREREEMRGRMQDLEDQVRDLMVFIEVGRKIEEAGGAEGEGDAGIAEAKGGSVVLPPPAGHVQEIGAIEGTKKKKKGKKR